MYVSGRFSNFFFFYRNAKWTTYKVKRLAKSEPTRRRSGSMVIKMPESPLKKRKRPSNTTSPISQLRLSMKTRQKLFRSNLNQNSFYKVQEAKAFKVVIPNMIMF